MASICATPHPLGGEFFPSALSNFQHILKRKEMSQICDQEAEEPLPSLPDIPCSTLPNTPLEINMKRLKRDEDGSSCSIVSNTSSSLDTANAIDLFHKCAEPLSAKGKGLLSKLTPGWLLNSIPQALKPSPGIESLGKVTSLMIRSGLGSYSMSVLAKFDFSSMSDKHTRKSQQFTPKPVTIRVSIGSNERKTGNAESLQGDGDDATSSTRVLDEASATSPVCSNLTAETHDCTAKQSNDKRSVVFRERLESILPMNTVALLREDCDHCVANIKNARCHNRVARKVKGVEVFMSTLVRGNIRAGDPASFEAIHKLIEYAMCGQARHRKVRLEKLENLLLEEARMSRADQALLWQWVSVLLNVTSLSDSASASISLLKTSHVNLTSRPSIAIGQTSRQPYSRPITRSMTRKLEQSEHYIQDFRPFPRKSDTTCQALLRVLNQPLKPREAKPGHIYIYWFPPNFGYLKIGVTERTPEERLQEWRTQCKHDAKIVYSAFVEHVYRVEKLVHVALREQRYREINCRGCGTNHKEWFKVRPDDAERAIAGVAAFMEEKPYEYRSEQGTLKNDVTPEAIKSLCSLGSLVKLTMEVKPKVSSPRRKSGSRLSLRRRNSRQSHIEQVEMSDCEGD